MSATARSPAHFICSAEIFLLTLPNEKAYIAFCNQEIARVRYQLLNLQFGSNRTESAVLLSSGALCVSGRYRILQRIVSQAKICHFHRRFKAV
jgi:hypothetical protein